MMPHCEPPALYRRLASALLLGLIVMLGCAAPSRAELPVAARNLLDRAGNTEDDDERVVLLEQLAQQDGLDPVFAADLNKLTKLARLYANRLAGWGPRIRTEADTDAINTGKFFADPDSPLWDLAWYYRIRVALWNILHVGMKDTEGARQWLRQCVDKLQELQAKYPANRVIGMYLGHPVPWEPKLAGQEGAPEWAQLQREGLERLSDIIHWWIDRQTDRGDFGGGWNDDCEMWRWWTPVLIGFEDPKVNAAQARLSLAAAAQPHLQDGYTSRMSDVQHTAEDTADTITPMMHLAPDDPQWSGRARRLSELMASKWTGLNDRGHLQFKHVFFTVNEIREGGQAAVDTVYHPRVVQPSLLLWQRTADPELGGLFTRWMDAWVDVSMRSDRGKPAGVIPSAMHFPTGLPGGAEGTTWQQPGLGKAFPWPSAMGLMTDTLTLAWYMTGDEKYLAPVKAMAEYRMAYIRSTPEERDAAQPGSMLHTACELVKMGEASRTSTRGALLGVTNPIAKYRALTGDTTFDDLLAVDLTGGTDFGPQARQQVVEGLHRALAPLRINWPAFTSEVRFTDRAMMFSRLILRMAPLSGVPELPHPDIAFFYRMVTGDPGDLGYFPLNAVRWLTPARDIAALAYAVSRTGLEADLYHFGDTPRAMGAEFYLLKPGKYILELSDAAQPAIRPIEFEVHGPRARVAFELPSRRPMHLKVTPTATPTP